MKNAYCLIPASILVILFYSAHYSLPSIISPTVSFYANALIDHVGFHSANCHPKLQSQTWKVYRKWHFWGFNWHFRWAQADAYAQLIALLHFYNPLGHVLQRDCTKPNLNRTSQIIKKIILGFLICFTPFLCQFCLNFYVKMNIFCSKKGFMFDTWFPFELNHPLSD